jgi:SWI/SNF-related matrix-associated actin-dependent regulator 1 of chromatin subfamily A
MSKEYEELHAELNKLAKKSGGLQGGEGLNQLAKLRKNLADLKVDAAVQHIKDVLQSVDKVLVFCHHRSVAGQLNCRLSRHQPAMINGDTPPKVRHEAVRRFQDQKGCRVFIGNLQAAGVGLTLTAASAVIFVESDWSPSQNLQCEDRAHRIGQKDTVLVHYLVLPGTLEERMAKACARKMVISSEVVDGGA